MKLLRATLIAILYCSTLIGIAAAAPPNSINPSHLKDKVTVKVGAKGSIQFKQDGDNLSEPKVIPGDAEASSSLGFNFSKTGTSLMLRVTNGFPKMLHYRAAARYKGRNGYYETSLIPIAPKLASYEMWADPIEELILFEFKLVDADAKK